MTLKTEPSSGTPTPSGSRGVEATRPPTGTGRLESVGLGSFTLDDGAALPELTVAYRHDGPPPGAAPQVLVVHALTGSADAAGDWWEPLIGPGLALDTEHVGVLAANLLGGSVYAQAFIADPSGPFAGVAFTAGRRLVLGD